MQDSLLYSGPQTGGQQRTASGARSRVTALLLTAAVVILAGGSVIWLQWAAQRSIELGYPMPTVHITPPSSNALVRGQGYQFSAAASGRDISVVWDFGDGNSASGSTVNHSYLGNGDYTVTVSVSDPAGHSNTDQLNVSVSPPPPQASFTYSQDAYGNVSFDASASTADASTSINSYNWDFGDGSTDTTSYSQENHTYSYTGTYQVTLYVVDATGQQSQTFSAAVVI
jgi:PKD repeat protein